MVFKEDEWVRITLNHNRNHKFIVKYSQIWDNPEYYIVDKWNPRKDEWCWFNNHHTLEDDLTLGRFHSMNGSCYNTKIGNKIITFFCCEPFSGKLPSFVENKN